MKLVEIKLTMIEGDDDVQIPWTGYVVVPGLAVCKTPKRVGHEFPRWAPAYRRWHVVHVPSGYRVGTNVLDFRSRTAAAATVRELGGLADWTKPTLELEAVPGLREKVRAVFFRRQ